MDGRYQQQKQKNKQQNKNAQAQVLNSELAEQNLTQSQIDDCGSYECAPEKNTLK